MNQVEIEDGIYLVSVKNNVGNNPSEWMRIPEDKAFQEWLLGIIRQASEVLLGDKN